MFQAQLVGLIVAVFDQAQHSFVLGAASVVDSFWDEVGLVGGKGAKPGRTADKTPVLGLVEDKGESAGICTNAPCHGPIGAACNRLASTGWSCTLTLNRWLEHVSTRGGGLRA